MKTYEKASSVKLTNRTPVIIRLDGRSFHTFTKGFKKPFDNRLIVAMQNTTLKLCKNISNTKIAYTQSDEISILMTDWDNLETQPMFDNKVHKLVSVTAAMATSYFIKEWYDLTGEVVVIQFDSRAFNIPVEEVNNYFVWRQMDWTRNSINMAGFSKFSALQMHGKNTSKVQEMLFKEHKINWNDFSVVHKRGTCILKHEMETEFGLNNVFVIDLNIPIFTKNKEYITNTYKSEV